MAHDHFIIVTHTSHLSAKKTLSQLRCLFINELSTSSIVMLCTDQNIINISHEKIDNIIDITIFFTKKIESKSSKLKKAESIVTALLMINSHLPSA